MLMTISPFVRQDRVDYYPSGDPFADNPATLAQSRHLTNWGTRADFSYASGINNIKIGTELQQTRLAEDFTLGITDPTFNPVCLTMGGDGGRLRGALVHPMLVRGRALRRIRDSHLDCCRLI